MAIYRIYPGNDGESHIEEMKLEEHPELGALTNFISSIWLARFVRDEEVGGSNPLTPTNFYYDYR